LPARTAPLQLAAGSNSAARAIAAAHISLALHARAK
jgi:hypothetical protein